MAIDPRPAVCCRSLSEKSWTIRTLVCSQLESLELTFQGLQRQGPQGLYQAGTSNGPVLTGLKPSIAVS